MIIPRNIYRIWRLSGKRNSSGLSHIFDKHSELRRVGSINLHHDSSAEYESILSSQFSVGTAPNGGYLINLAIAAALDSDPRYKTVIAVNGYYLARADESSKASIICTIHGSNDTTKFVKVNIVQNSTVRCTFLVVLEKERTMRTNRECSVRAPQLPPPEQCVDGAGVMRKVLGNNLKVAQHFEFLVPHKSAFSRTVLADVAGGEDAMYEGWLRFTTPRVMCSRALAFMLDALPPPIHIRSPITSALWVPTMNYSVYIWNSEQLSPNHLADSNCISYIGEGFVWYPFKFSSKLVVNGVLLTEGEIWNPTGTDLMASSRQMARVLTPR